MSTRTVVVQWPGTVPATAAEEDLPTSDAVAMVRFLLARLREDEAALRGTADLRTARRIGATRSLAQSWLDAVNPDGEVEVEGWERGFADGILLGLFAAALIYDDHPDFREDWA